MNDEIPKQISLQISERPGQCPVHGAHTERGMQWMAGGPIRWTGCSSCNREERDREEAAERARKEAERQARLESKLKTAGIPMAFRERTLDNFLVEGDGQQCALDVAREFADNFWSRHTKVGSFLVLAGDPGTGKSHLAIAAAQQVMQRGTALYIRTADIIRRVRATWRRDAPQTEEDVFNALEAMDLLIIDEVGVQAGTEDEQRILFDVIDRRYAGLKPTILLTNLGGAAFKEFMGPRIMDRLNERAVFVPFRWESYRGRVSQ